MGRLTAANFFARFDTNHDNALSSQELPDYYDFREAWRELDVPDSIVVAQAMDMDTRRRLFKEMRPEFIDKWDNGATNRIGLDVAVPKRTWQVHCERLAVASRNSSDPCAIEAPSCRFPLSQCM